MLVKNIFGIVILILNAAGVGFILFLGFQRIINHFFPKDEGPELDIEAPPPKKPLVINEDLIPDEDDLLKDMDLSDLDNLNLDDFE